MKELINVLHPVCNAKIRGVSTSGGCVSCNSFGSQYKTKRKNVGCIPDYSGFHFASRWTFWKLTTTNIKMQTGYPWRNELIHEYVRFYLKNIDISKVLSFFVWVKYWNSCKTVLQRNVFLEPEPINFRWWSRSLKFGSWFNKHCCLSRDAYNRISNPIDSNLQYSNRKIRVKFFIFPKTLGK